LFVIRIEIYDDSLIRARKVRNGIKSLKERFGDKRNRRSTSAAVILHRYKNNKVSNQSAELSEKLKEGRHRLKSHGKKKTTTDIIDDPFVTPESSTSTVTSGWATDQNDLECFLKTMSSNGFEDENVFNDGMESIFGRVSKTTKPSICVTPDHILLLQIFYAELLTEEDKSNVTVWIHRLQKYCVENSEGIK
jgi:hypothetical protein